MNPFPLPHENRICGPASSWQRSSFPGSGSSRRPDRAFSLLEMIGVTAVIAILAAIFFSTTLKQLDRIASDKEYAQLGTIAQAFQNSVLRNRYIPGASNWVQVVAQEMGADTGMVSSNARRSSRAFLIDPALQVGVNGGGLPYLQNTNGSVVTSNGVVIPPVNPRLLFLSSLGPPLPGAITNGGLTANDFNAIWVAADGSRPPGSVWDAWNGSGDDLKVRRLNLSPLFAHLILDSLYSTNLGQYAIDGSAANSVPPTNAVDAYFLNSSVLNLVSGDGVSDCKQIIARDCHFVYTMGIWRGGIYDGPTPSTPIMAVMVSQFLASPNNPHATNTFKMRYNYGLLSPQPETLATKPLLVDHYKQYMQKYIDWSQAGFPIGAAYDPIYKTPLSKMRDDIKDIGDRLDNNIVPGDCTF